MLERNRLLQNRYRIVRPLGSGGMGAVYEAIDERFGQPIALKEIIAEVESSYQQSLISKSFEREAKSLAIARHEAVPFVRDYFTEGGSQFLVMELVEGDDLAAMLKNRNSPFPIPDLLNWMGQLLDALDYLHTLKPPIIHRDIKPQNLKVSSRNRIKLLDFGIARSSDKTSTLNSHTFVGASLNYSPIEQMLRVMDLNFLEYILQRHQDKADRIMKQDTDGRCDIFALGGTFYHLMTNQIPVDALKRTLSIWDGKGDPLKSPNELNPEISPILSFVVMKALEVDRRNRYATAKEMEEDLKKANQSHFVPPPQNEDQYATLVDSKPQRIESSPTESVVPSAPKTEEPLPAQTQSSQVVSNTSAVEITSSNLDTPDSLTPFGSQSQPGFNKTLFKSQIEEPTQSKFLSNRNIVGIGAVCLVVLISSGLFVAFNGIPGFSSNSEKVPETTVQLKETTVLIPNEPAYLQLGVTNDTINKANDCYEKKNYQCVIDSFSNIIRSTPKNAVAFNNRAVAHFQKGNYSQAINDLTQAINLNPQNPAFFHNRALAYTKTNDKAKAKRDEEQVASLPK